MNTLSLLQLNIWYGNFLPEIIQYVRAHDFDVLTFQELSSPYLKIYKQGNKGIDCRAYLETHLPDYTLCFFPTVTYSDEPGSYFGQATLVKKSQKVVKSWTTWLRPAQTLSRDYQVTADELTRLCRACGWVEIELGNGVALAVGNVHGPWGADGGLDSPEKTRQYDILYDSIQDLQTPWVLAGDFNMPATTAAMTKLSSLGTNLIVHSSITNTMNPAHSRIFEFMPAGTAVDTIIHSPTISNSDFHLIEITSLSDHYGLSVVLRT